MTGLANRYTLEYAPAQMGDLTRTAIIAPTSDAADARVRRDTRCAESLARLGVELEAEPIECPHIFDEPTAFSVLVHRAARNAFPIEQLEVVGVDLAFLEVGDIVLVSSARHGWVERPAVVVLPTIDGAWVKLTLEVIPSLTLT